MHAKIDLIVLECLYVSKLELGLAEASGCDVLKNPYQNKRSDIFVTLQMQMFNHLFAFME